MSIIFTDLIDEILSVGINLQEYGVKNWALSRPQAIYAVLQLQKHHIPVSGGDVYVCSHGQVHPNYDSWYCNNIDYESPSDYAERSISVTIDYIYAYPTANSIEILFVIVPHITPV